MHSWDAQTYFCYKLNKGLKTAAGGSCGTSRLSKTSEGMALSWVTEVTFFQSLENLMSWSDSMALWIWCVGFFRLEFCVRKLEFLLQIITSDLFSFRPFLSVLLVSPWNKTQGTHLLLLSINVAGCRISNLLLFRHHLLDNAYHESCAFSQPCSISDELGCDGQFAWAWLWKIWALVFNLAFTDLSISELFAVYVSGVNRSWNSWSCNGHICALNWWAFYLNPCTSRVARR